MSTENKAANMLNTMQFKYKFMMVLALPVIAFIYFAYNGLTAQYSQIHEARAVESTTVFNNAVSALIHDLQVERGATAVFLKSGGKKFAAEIGGFRSSTDSKYEILKSAITANALAALTQTSRDRFNILTASGSLDGLSGLRTQANAKSIKAGEAAAYYTSTIADMLKVVADTVSLSSDKVMARTASAYYSMLLAKESAGQERAVLGGVFASGKITSKARTKAVSLSSVQEAYVDSFKNMAELGQIQFYTTKLVGSSVDEVSRMRGIIQKAKTTDALGVDSGYWFQQSTNRINLLNEVALKVANDLAKSSGAIATALEDSITTKFTMIAIFVALGALFSFVVARQTIIQERLGAIAGSCLANLGNNVIISDEKDMISYMNGSSLQSLTDLTNEIKDVFVGFDASKLIGGDIHQFHKDPERIKRILTDLKEGEVHKGRINLVVLRFQ